MTAKFWQAFKQEMQWQLQNGAMNVALGIVSERPYVKRVQNPYAHFGRPDLWTEGFRQNNQRYMPNHVYRICEVRPPSIEKVYKKTISVKDVFVISGFLLCHTSSSTRMMDFSIGKRRL